MSASPVLPTETVNDSSSPAAVKSTNLSIQRHKISLDDRASRNGHFGGVLWLTGLSGAGKSTIAMMTELALWKSGYQVYVLDGDNQRFGLSSDLGFSPKDRSEHIRRVGETASLFAKSGVICICSFISPYREDRDRARLACRERFHEIYISTPLDVCEKRDPKGLYKRARAGELHDFTGIDAPYEAPLDPELTVDCSAVSPEQAVLTLLEYVERKFYLDAQPKIMKLTPDPTPAPDARRFRIREIRQSYANLKNDYEAMKGRATEKVLAAASGVKDLMKDKKSKSESSPPASPAPAASPSS